MGLLLCYYLPHQVVSAHIPEQKIRLLLLKQLQLNHNICYAFQGLLEQLIGLNKWNIVGETS